MATAYKPLVIDGVSEQPVEDGCVVMKMRVSRLSVALQPAAWSGRCGSRRRYATSRSDRRPRPPRLERFRRALTSWSHARGAP